MADINDWDISAANNNSAPPDGWPENTMQYSEVNNTAREGMAVIARYFKDLNGSLAAAGAANAYTVTLNASYAAYFEGMYFACSIPADNTGASTINVNSIGAKSIVNRDGSALSAGTLQADGIYEFRYDGTNFQLMGTVAGSNVILSGIELRTDIVTATPPTTEAVTGLLSIKDLDGSDELAQIGFDGTNTLNFINTMHGGAVNVSGQDASGSAQTIFYGDPDGASAMYYAGVPRLLAAGTGVAVLKSDGDTDTEVRVLSLQHNDGTERAIIGHNTSGVLRFYNAIDSGTIAITANDALSAEVNILTGDPDGETRLYQNATKTLALTGGGVVRLYSAGNTDTENRYIVMAHADGTSRAQFGHNGADSLLVRNFIAGGALSMSATATPTGTRTLFSGDPDGSVSIYHPADSEINIQTGAHDGSDRSSGADVRGADGTLRGIGYNSLPRVTVSGGNHTLVIGDQGMSLFYNEVTARSILFNNDATIPVDAYGHIRVGPSGGTLTLDAGTGVTLTYWDGSAYVAHTAAANLEVLDGSYTWWKQSDTNYYIDGPAITAV